MNAINDYYYAKEREESAVLRINDAYLEALNSLEKLEAENAKLRDACADIYEMAYHEYPSAFEAAFAGRLRELGVEVDK